MENNVRRVSRMPREAIEHEKKIRDIFASKGWNAVHDYRIGDNQIDVALFDKGKLVGCVEAKLIESKFIFKHETERALKLMKTSGIAFYILVVNDNAYMYTENGFARITDIPLPSNYQSIKKEKPVDFEEIFGKSNGSESIQQSKNSEDLAKLISMLKSANDKMDQVIDLQKDTNNKLDDLSKQVRQLSESIDSFKSLTGRLIEKADNDDEIDRIVDVLTDAILEKTQKEFISSLSKEDLASGKSVIENYFGDSLNKLSEESKKYLTTAVLMFNKLKQFGNEVDYSGVCILVTKCIELEMTQHFYFDYKNYLINKFGDADSDLTNWPYGLFKNHTKQPNKMLLDTKVTMGTFAEILCFNRNNNTIREDQDLLILIDYCNEEVFEIAKSREDAKDVIKEIASDIETIRKEYRNPSAHRSPVDLQKAQKCFDYLIFVDRVLINILSYIK